MPTVSIQRHEIFYSYQPGPAGSSTLLLLHGAGNDHTVWPDALSELEGVSLLALDLPGHGKSTGPGYETVSGYANIVASFIKKLGLTPIILGHSMGGAIALQIALYQDPGLAGLVLIGASAQLRVSDAILEGIGVDFAQTVRTIHGYSWSPGAPPAAKALTGQLLEKCRPEVLQGDFVACSRFDVSQAVPGMHLPALVIGGSSDLMVPPRYSRLLAESLPNSHYIEVEDSGHYVMLEQPAIVVSAIEEWLRTRLHPGDS